MHDLLSGRTALVAGGTGNVGRVIVKAMIDAGATVAVPSRSREKLENLRSEVGVARRDRLVSIEGNIADDGDARRVLDEIVSRAGPLDAAVASLGQFVAVPSVLAATMTDLQRALDGYLIAHFTVARTVIPALTGRGGSYTFMNGPLAFRPMFPGAGLVSIVTAAQAMLARVSMIETEGTTVRVNEVVVHTRFGWGDDPGQHPISQDDVGRYVALLASSSGETVRGRTIHLDSTDPLEELAAASRSHTSARNATGS